MSLATYADLLSAVANWTDRSDLGSYDDDFVTLGESRIYSELRVRAMETTVASTIASGVIAVPSSYLELKNAYISSTTPYTPLGRTTPNAIYENYPTRSASGTPAFIAREGSNFIFGPYPDSNYTVTLVYWAKPSALSSAVNTIFTNYPGLYLFASLCEAAPFLKDRTMGPIWEQKYKEILVRCQMEDDKEDWSGSSLAMRPYGISIK